MYPRPLTTINVIALRVSHGAMINYCYLVIDTQSAKAILIDPAWDQKKIEDVLKESMATLTGVLLTHHHRDHIDLASFFAKKYQIPVYMSKEEINFYHFQCENLIAIEQFTPFDSLGFVITPIFTPGHTKGGTSYLIANNLFCGDTLFIEGCGLCGGNGANPEVMFDTLELLKNTILPDTRIYPGHRYGRPVGQNFESVLLNNIYLQFTNKADFVAFRMRPNQQNLFNFK